MSINTLKTYSFQSKFLWIAWTIWFVLDPHLNLWYEGIEWTLSIGIASWFIGVLILVLKAQLLKRYGISALIISIISIFFLLWGVSIITPVVILPNPYQLISLWKTTSIELYINFLSWLEGWVVCLIVVLLIGEKWSKRYG